MALELDTGRYLPHTAPPLFYVLRLVVRLEVQCTVHGREWEGWSQ